MWLGFSPSDVGSSKLSEMHWLHICSWVGAQRAGQSEGSPTVPEKHADPIFLGLRMKGSGAEPPLLGIPRIFAFPPELAWVGLFFTR